MCAFFYFTIFYLIDKVRANTQVRPYSFPTISSAR